MCHHASQWPRHQLLQLRLCLVLGPGLNASHAAQAGTEMVLQRSERASHDNTVLRAVEFQRPAARLPNACLVMDIVMNTADDVVHIRAQTVVSDGKSRAVVFCLPLSLPVSSACGVGGSKQKHELVLPRRSWRGKHRPCRPPRHRQPRHERQRGERIVTLCNH